MVGRAQILATITRPSARWYPGLATPLAARKWTALAERGFDVENYGTTRILTAEPTASRGIEGILDIAGNPTILESFSEEMVARYEQLGLCAADERLVRDTALARLAQALAIVRRVPRLSDTLAALVRSVHLIEVEAPEFDASYSDPDVPFSIFVGIHAEPTFADGLRLAESIIHEAMHLQLTLIEAQVPLVSGTNELVHSPWQDRPRPAQGLLHGLYVFRVIQDFLAALPEEEIGSGGARHVRHRLALIDKECAELSGFDTSDDLTPEGKILVRSLLVDRRLSSSAAA